ncbi:MAG: DNA polymerase III subunit epsilon [Pseudomonadota bacterium]
MREIALDTETTGLEVSEGHRIVEIGAVELINHLPTGNSLHLYINPERAMPKDAEAIHGLGDAFLRDKPVFAAVVREFLDFLADAPLVIHNAAFDMAMINAELSRLGRPALAMSRAVDTTRLARKRFPGSPVNLDVLCKRFGIDNSGREKHGALIDAELLAAVYLELLGGRQTGLSLETVADRSAPDGAARHASTARPRPRSLPPRLTEAEREAHRSFVDEMGPSALWAKRAAPSP